MTSYVDSITFLDVLIHKDGDGHLTSMPLYRNSTTGNSIPHAKSFNPRPLVDSIPYSQYLHLKRNCSEDSSFKLEADSLRERLLLRVYSSSCLRKANRRAITKTHQELLYNQKPANANNPIRIITRLSYQHLQIKKIVSRYWHLLKIDPNVSPLIPDFTVYNQVLVEGSSSTAN